MLRPGGLFVFVEPASSSNGETIKTIESIFPKEIVSTESAGAKLEKAKAKDMKKEKSKKSKKSKNSDVETFAIDEDNDIHVHIRHNIIDIFNEKNIEVVIGNRKFSIYVNKLYINPKQTVILRGRGIPRIIVDDIYNVEKRGNIHIHIELSTITDTSIDI